MFFSPSRRARAAPLLATAGALLLSACSPRLDWRDVQFDEAGLQLLLPCKADRGERTVPLAGQPTAVRMVGCDAAGATFALAAAAVDGTAQAAVVEAHWREAVRANLRLPAGGPGSDPASPAGPAGSAIAAASSPSSSPASSTAAGLPPGVLLLRGLRPGPEGAPVLAYARWFTHTAAGGATYVVHAVVYAERAEPEAAEMFFGAIRAR